MKVINGFQTIANLTAELHVATKFGEFCIKDDLVVILRLEKGAFVGGDDVMIHRHVSDTLRHSCLDQTPREVHIDRLLQQCHESEVSTVGYQRRAEQEHQAHQILANVHYLFHHAVRSFCSTPVYRN